MIDMKKIIAFGFFLFASNASAQINNANVSGSTDKTIMSGASTNSAITQNYFGNFQISGPRPWIDVRAYGAKGNGSTDDTTAIQNAINAAKNIDGNGTSATVFVPSGIYLINSTGLTLSGNAGSGSNGVGIELRGEGIGSQLQSKSSNTTMITITGNRNSIRNIFFNSLSTQTNVTHIKLDATTTNTNFNRLDNLYFNYGSTNVVMQAAATGAAYNQISNMDSLFVSSCGVWLQTITDTAQNSNGTYIQNVRVGSAPNAYGIYLDGAGQTTIVNFAAEGLNYGIFVASSPFNSNHGGAEGTSIIGGRYESETTSDIFLSTWSAYTAIFGGDLEFGIGTHIIDNGNGTVFLGNPSVTSFSGWCYGGATCPSDGAVHMTKATAFDKFIQGPIGVSLTNNTPTAMFSLGHDFNPVTKSTSGILAMIGQNGFSTPLYLANNNDLTMQIQANAGTHPIMTIGIASSPITNAAYAYIDVGDDTTNRNFALRNIQNFGVNTSTPSTTIEVNGNAQFGSGGAKSTFTVNGDLIMNKGSSITLSGVGGTIVTQSTVTAALFIGDGSKITNILISTAGTSFANQQLMTTSSPTFGGATITSAFFIGKSTTSASAGWTTFTPGPGTAGCNGAITNNSSKYILLGNSFFFTMDIQCTSNSTSWNVTIPFNLANANQQVACDVEDNGAFQATGGWATVNGVGSAIVVLNKDGTEIAASWTNLGTKRVICNGVFEIQ